MNKNFIDVVRVRITTKKNGKSVKPYIEFINDKKDAGFWDGFVGWDKDDAYFGIDCKKGQEQKKARRILMDRIKENKKAIKDLEKENIGYEELLNTLA